MREHDRIRDYLRALAALAYEVSDKPWLLPVFLQLLALVPGTLRCHLLSRHKSTPT
jgi:hypothetical protein